MENKNQIPKNTLQILILSAVISLLLFSLVYLSYQSSRARPGSIILPAGPTYLGPSPEPTDKPSRDTIPIQASAPFAEYKGKIYKYVFSYPSTISLGTFPQDQSDSVTIFWKDTDPGQNMFFQVINLRAIEETKKYIQKPKKEYVMYWWKQYAWRGVASVSEFTNSNGLKGYKAKYIDITGQTPYDHVFFEVPGKPELMIWLSGRLFEEEIFTKIIESVKWEK